jgi:hypothetical protein
MYPYHEQAAKVKEKRQRRKDYAHDFIKVTMINCGA